MLFALGELSNLQPFRTHPADGINATAEKEGCDLIIMASHGYRGVKKILLGSVANEVLAHAPVPVLIHR